MLQYIALPALQLTA